MNYKEAAHVFRKSALPPELIPLVSLRAGGGSRDDQICVMELVAWLKGEPETYEPRCADPEIAAYCIHLNDSSGQSVRDDLRDMALKILNTRDEEKALLRQWSLLASMVANLAEAFTHVTDPGEREKLAPIISSMTERLTHEPSASLLDLTDLEVGDVPLTSVFDVSKSLWAYRCANLIELAWDLGVSGYDSARFMQQCDEYFGTAWDSDASEDKLSPRPGARALQALESMISLSNTHRAS